MAIMNGLSISFGWWSASSVVISSVYSNENQRSNHTLRNISAMTSAIPWSNLDRGRRSFYYREDSSEGISNSGSAKERNLLQSQMALPWRNVVGTCISPEAPSSTDYPQIRSWLQPTLITFQLSPPFLTLRPFPSQTWKWLSVPVDVKVRPFAQRHHSRS